MLRVRTAMAPRHWPTWVTTPTPTWATSAWATPAAVVLLSAVMTVASPIAGPFRIVPDHLDECPPEMRPQKKYYIATYSAVRDRSNPDTWFYSFNTTTFLPCTDDYTLSVNLASWSSRGGWKDNAFQKTIAKPCTTVRSFFPREWRKAMVYVFNDPDRKCPFPPGTYTATNVSTQNDFTFPPSFFYGKFRGTGRVFTLAKELVGCVRFYFSIVPKHP